MSHFDDLNPTPEEIAALTRPLTPGAITRARDWTTPTPEEVARLAARARPQPRRRAPVVGLLAAAAALLVMQLEPTPLSPRLSPPIPPPAPVVVYVAPEVPLNVAHVLDSPLQLGPSITVTGSGEISVMQAGEDGTALTLLSGSATFEVDPDGQWRALAVHVGDVVVTVTGTRFTVSADPISVSVERGSVRVDHPDGRADLTAGGYWTVPPVFRPIQPPPTAPAAPESRNEGLQAALAWSEIQNARDAGADADEVLRRIDTFTAQYPTSPLIEEATAWRLTVLIQVLPPEELLPEIDAWLAAWPRSNRRAEVLLLRGNQTRLTGDCVMASAFYQAVLAEPAPPLHEDALKWIRWCEAP